MSLPDFAKAMDTVVKGTDFETVNREGVRLITAELGAGVPAYVPILERFAKRLEDLAPRRPVRSAGEPL